MHHAGLESVRLEQVGRLHVAMKLEGVEMCRSNVPLRIGSGRPH